MRHFVFLLLALLLSACEWDAQKQNLALSYENEELRLQLHLSTRYIEDVTEIIDHVQRNLQNIEEREGIIGRISLRGEGTAVSRAVNVRRKLMSSISDIDAYLNDNRRKMELLAQRVSESTVRIGSLEKVISNLSAQVDRKEREVVQLKTHVQRLEADVTALEGRIIEKELELQDKAETISVQKLTIQQRDTEILQQQTAAETVFFVVDSREELKRKGLIVERRSGFLGLKKKVQVGTIYIRHFDEVRKDHAAIELRGDPQNLEVVSAHRDRPDLYNFENSESGSHLTISNTDDFWALSQYLIIVSSN